MQVSSEQKVSPAKAVVAEMDQVKRPGLAIISAQLTPYRLHFLRRVANELDAVRLFSVFTHDVGESGYLYAPALTMRPTSTSFRSSTLGDPALLAGEGC
jgi:hypothetical protein